MNEHFNYLVLDNAQIRPAAGMTGLEKSTSFAGS